MSDCALLRCDGCGVRRRVDFLTDGMGHLVEEAAPCKCTPVVERAEPIAIMPKMHADKPTQEKIREYVASRIATDHTLKAEAVADEVRQRFGVEMGEGTFYNTYWTPLRKEVRTPVSTSNGNGAAPVNRIAALSPEPRPAPTPPAPVVEEVRSLRATYEGDPYLRVEEEDGEWRLRANLPFATRAEAFRAAAALSGALEE